MVTCKLTYRKLNPNERIRFQSELIVGVTRESKNLDLRVILAEGNTLTIRVNGNEKNEHYLHDKNLSKVYLANNPYSYRLPKTLELIQVYFCQRMDQLMVRYEGVETESMMDNAFRDRIYKQKVENKQTS